MKTWSRPWCLGLALSATLAAHDPWTPTDTAFQAACIAADLIDWHQTRELIHRPGLWENNPILGHHPSIQEVDGYFAASILLGATVFTNGQSSDAATGVALNGTDVWVTGSIGIQAVVWKNGQALALTSSTDKSAGQLLGLSVSAGSVWFCGVYGSQAAYWDKTGAGWKLTNGTELLSSANGIFVVTH